MEDVRHGGHHVLYNNNNIRIPYTALFASPGVGGIICYDDVRNDDDAVRPGIIILLL